MKNFLINEDLYQENVYFYENQDLDYINEPHTVGITSNCTNGKRKYVVYINNQQGYLEYTKVFHKFTSALIYALCVYKQLMNYENKIVVKEKKRILNIQKLKAINNENAKSRKREKYNSKLKRIDKKLHEYYKEK